MEEYTGITYGESWNEEWNHLIPAAIEIIHQILSIPQNVRAVPVAYGVPMELLAQLEQLAQPAQLERLARLEQPAQLERLVQLEQPVQLERLARLVKSARLARLAQPEQPALRQNYQMMCLHHLSITNIL